MEYIVYFKWSIGIILFTLIGVASSSKYRSGGQNDRRAFVDDDQRAERKKREATNNTSYNFGNQGNGSLEASSIHLLNQEDVTERPGWLNESENQNWYGVEFYLNRTLYTKDKNKPPTVCFNNITKVENNTRVLLSFICPMSHQGNTLQYCCGTEGQQVCCTKLAYNTEKKKLDEEESSLNDIDLVTGLSIAGACAACITLCMLLYCCCCQRRPEIHDGIKLMWVRRSFGKELSRLEQPTYPNHLAVVSSSRAASRSGSRSGSRFGSHQGSRNPSRGPSPSVSRRESCERSPSKKHKVSRLEQPTYPNHLAVVSSSRAASRSGSRSGSRFGSHQGSRNPSRGPSPSVSRRESCERSPSKKHKVSAGQNDRQKLTMDVASSVVITVTTPSDEHGPTNPLLKAME